MSESGGGFFPWTLQKLQLRSSTPTTGDAISSAPPHSNHSSSQGKHDMGKQQQQKVSVKPPPPPAQQQVVPNLVTEEKAVIDNMPPLFPKPSSSTSPPASTDDWEFLSDKVSSSGNNSSCHYANSHHSHHSHTFDGVMVAKAGSVRSIASLGDQIDGAAVGGPCKLQRTHSSSTIDSTDHTLGPSGKGVLGVDYVEHVILPTDTLQGICLAYKISATRLKQANHFSGNSLSLAPKKLVIPLSKMALQSGYIRSQDTDAKEYKLHAILAEYRHLTLVEAKAYLELADWILKDALQSVKEDHEWEAEIDSGTRKSGEIRISVRGGVLSAQGAGLPRRPVKNDNNNSNGNPTEIRSATQEQTKVTSYATVPSPNVNAEDVYKAVEQHDNAGVELKPLSSKKCEEQQSR